jgi:N-acetyl-gamma-glutamyl-phosphate reductase
VIINAASGVSGAGRTAKPHLHFPEIDGGFSAYAPGVHRHQIEIEQTLSTVTSQPVSALFVPHLLPITQGIFETIYLEPAQASLTELQLYEAFENAYAGKPFVRVRKELPNIKHVVNTNFVDIAVRLVNAGGEPNQEPAATTNETAGQRIIVFAAEDNVIKGASGQAVQNMNLMFGLDQTTGLA